MKINISLRHAFTRCWNWGYEKPIAIKISLLNPSIIGFNTIGTRHGTYMGHKIRLSCTILVSNKCLKCDDTCVRAKPSLIYNFSTAIENECSICTRRIIFNGIENWNEKGNHIIRPNKCECQTGLTRRDENW